jgi:hypothetical protein
LHGQNGIACVQCHTHITGYPHPAITSQTRREYTIDQRNNCASCHKEAYDTKVNDAHTIARDNGNLNAAVCSDCHGAHDILPVADQRSRLSRVNIINTCGKCHTGSHRRFAGYLTHATHHDPKYPFLVDLLG